YPIDLFLPLAIAPVASLHGIRRRWQPRIIQKRQGFVQRGGKELLQRVTEGGASLDMSSPLRQCIEGGLGPTAPIAYRVYRLHDRPQRLALGYPTADAPQGLPCGCAQVTLDEQMACGAQRGAWRGEPLCGAGGLLGCWRARAPSTQCGWCGCQAL